MKPILEVHGISKKFKIHHENQSYLSLRDSLINLFNGSSSSNEEFWALKDVSFTINPGESIGVIGRNGAGKSTLLKILSKITPPSSGKIISRGRIASLLEVGTGFHPELTGRENIFLNGSILGLKKSEILKQFDAIVEFSGVEQFLDTSLKHYSSGMQLRLAFAVAAHLEPEILIIDEVLAVGDAEFQKKCMGKMDEVSKSGRTILFVSHNMAAIQSLTTKSLLLNKGQLLSIGSTPDIVQQYSSLMIKDRDALSNQIESSGKLSKINRANLLDPAGNLTSVYTIGEDLLLEIFFEIFEADNTSLELFLVDNNNIRIGIASLYQFHEVKLPKEKGKYKLNVNLGPLNIASGSYSIDISTSVINSHCDHYVFSACSFDVIYSNPNHLPWDFKQDYLYGNTAFLLKEKPSIIPLT